MNKIIVVCQKEHENGYEDYVGICLLCEIERLKADINQELEAAEERVVNLFENMENPYLPDITKAIRARGQA